MTSSMPESISSVLSLVYDTMPLREPNDDDDEEEDDDEDSRTSGYQGTRRRRIGHPIVVITPIVLPWLLQSGLEAAARVLLEPGERSDVDFSRPTDEPALIIAPLCLVARMQEPARRPRKGASFRAGGPLWAHTTRRVSAAVARLRER